MGCGCRSGRRGASRSNKSKSPAVRNKQKSTCSRLENLGNQVNVKIGPGGRIFLAAPLGSGAGLSVAALLPSLGCNGSFAKALKGAEVKTMGIFTSPNKLSKFKELIPHSVVKLSYLRSVLQHF